MRIIAGKNKGTTLYFSENKITRPLKDRVREGIFNLLIHSNKISFEFENSNILDLYSGTGSFGLECLSRKAGNVYFIEKSKDIKKILEKNIEKLKVKKNSTVFCDDVLNLIEKKNIFKLKFDLVFCDPPFQDKKMTELIEKLFYKNLIHKNTLVILHRNKKTKEKLSYHLKIIDERIYGISKIIFAKFLP